MYEVALGYMVGSAASLLLFRTWIKERIVSVTLDMLISEDFVRSYEDEDGITQLYRIDELPGRDEISPELWERIVGLIQEMGDEDDSVIEAIMNSEEEEDHETNDTP